MRILLIGNGAREHAIAKSIAKSSKNPELYSFISSKNPGIVGISKEFFLGDICDVSRVVSYATDKKIDFAVVGPEAPLAAGVSDELEANGIPCIGPMGMAAQLETDKSFARNLMEKYKIEGIPEFGVFDNKNDAIDFIENFKNDFVIKPAGLTGGKGVKILGEHLKDLNDAKKYIGEIFDRCVGSIKKVVIEEKLIGEEFTIQAFVDGKNVIGMPMVQDHKRAYEGDTGPNTGGMGSYSDTGHILPFLRKDDYENGIRVMKKAIEAVKGETGISYKGFLYGQFMATRNGIKLIEFNARLGDPEAMNVLSILQTDFVEICNNIIDGNLRDNIKFDKKATVCKYMVPAGYPENPKSNSEISVDERGIGEIGGGVYYASVKEENGRILTSSSRAIAVLGVGNSISEAEEIAENSMKFINGDLFHRRDIGTKELIEKRIRHMKELRGN